MTAAEMVAIVYSRELAGDPTDSYTIARDLGEEIQDVRGALRRGHERGFLARRYRVDAPFGKRDTYITTPAGQQATKEMAL